MGSVGRHLQIIFISRFCIFSQRKTANVICKCHERWPRVPFSFIFCQHANNTEKAIYHILIIKIIRADNATLTYLYVDKKYT